MEPLDCVGTLINTLVALNTTLVRLEPAAVTLEMVRKLAGGSAAAALSVDTPLMEAGIDVAVFRVVVAGRYLVCRFN